MRFNVQGMTCAHCERAVQRAVAAIGGTAKVDVAGGTVEVAGNDNETAVRQAIEAEGYTVVSDPATPAVSGCCASKR